MKTYLVCFDITDDKSRNKVGNLLLAYGERVQLSVFEIALNNNRELAALKTQLQTLMEEGDDLRFYYLSKETRRQSEDVYGNAIADFPSVIIV
ncbi:CRISPR-associated endonuclease Cas2 [Teredinibacter turnerae]|uniref:CRISPR-associated endonuclease Cas2 n=1 Tax=Teredinibacter turnerae TaxID=2426 RepID=UPI00037BBB29|nr:CRISPR-associated endonuclease Cas2 [Teredinibacter turnerae]